MLISRGQRQILHQLDCLSSLLRKHFGDEQRNDNTNNTISALDPVAVAIPLAATLALGALGVILFKVLPYKK